MTTAPENLLNQHTKRRIPTSSSTSSTLFPSKGSLGSSFRYEKSRPRARTLHSTTLSKGHTSRASLSSSCPSSTKLGSTDAGHHRISIASRGSVAGPKSASSRISLERIQEEGISMIMKKEHAGHVCSRDSCSSTSSSSSSSSTLAPTTTGTLKRSGGISRRKEEEGHQQYVADGSEPNSSSTTLLSSSSNGGQQDVNTNADTRGAHRSAVSTGSSSSPSCRPDMGTTVALATGPSTTTTATATATTTASTTTTTTPRRIHIAPLRLVNSNVAGVTPTSASNTAINLTSSWPSSGLPLSSSSSLLSSQPVHRFDRNIINTTAATSQPRTVSMSSSSSAAGGGPMMMMMMSGQHGCRPNMMMSSGDSIPASAPTASSSSWPSIYQQQQQIKSAAAAQFLPSISSAKIPLGQQHDLSITDTIETKRRRTSDFTVMRVVHHPSPPSSSYSFGERRELSRSTPASFLPSNGTGHNVGGYTGKYHGYTSPAVGDVKVQQHQQHHHRDSIGWPSTGSHPHQQRAPHPTYTHLPTSPAYRFPSIPTTATHHHHSHQSSSSSSSIWHIGTSPPLSESFLPYDSMRGSLKRKASLGLVESSSNSTHRRRRSSGEMTVGSGSARRGSSGNSLVNSRGHNRRNSQGGDKLPPLIRPYQSSEAHSPGTSSNYETM